MKWSVHISVATLLLYLYRYEDTIETIINVWKRLKWFFLKPLSLKCSNEIHPSHLITLI